jgi:peptide methionine sulfoxide reductase MsrB
MAVVDHERAWLAFKKVVTSKASHGQRDLLAEMARIEIECEVPEGQQGYDGSPAPVHEIRTKPAEKRPALGTAHG